MKKCKSCCTSIDDNAKICPNCRTYQYWWKNPQWLLMVFFIPYLIFALMPIASIRNRSVEKFEDYRGQINARIVKSVRGESSSRAVVYNIEVENKTDLVWKRPTFMLERLGDKGEVLATEHINDYQMVIPAQTKIMTTITSRLLTSDHFAGVKVKITSLSNERF